MNKNKAKNLIIICILVFSIVVILYVSYKKFTYDQFYVRHKQIDNIEEINLLCDAYGISYSDNISSVEFISSYNMDQRTGMLELTIDDMDVFFSENVRCKIYDCYFEGYILNEIEIDYSDVVIDPSYRNDYYEGVIVFGTSHDVKIFAGDGVSREGNIIFSYDEDGNVTICFYINIDSRELRQNVISIRKKYYYDEFASHIALHLLLL